MLCLDCVARMAFPEQPDTPNFPITWVWAREDCEARSLFLYSEVANNVRSAKFKYPIFAL